VNIGVLREAINNTMHMHRFEVACAVDIVVCKCSPTNALLEKQLRRNGEAEYIFEVHEDFEGFACRVITECHLLYADVVQL